jgi:hypothetical protein
MLKNFISDDIKSDKEKAMIFDGIRFCYNKNIVSLPWRLYRESNNPNYIRFGKVVPANKPVPCNAIKTDWTRPDGSAVFAVEIPNDGWSLTNMMYGKNGRIYLMRDGKCYSAKCPLRVKNMQS